VLFQGEWNTSRPVPDLGRSAILSHAQKIARFFLPNTHTPTSKLFQINPTRFGWCHAWKFICRTHFQRHARHHSLSHLRSKTPLAYHIRCSPCAAPAAFNRHYIQPRGALRRSQRFATSNSNSSNSYYPETAAKRSTPRQMGEVDRLSQILGLWALFSDHSNAEIAPSSAPGSRAAKAAGRPSQDKGRQSDSAQEYQEQRLQ
jgi:hypothetical protein